MTEQYTGHVIQTEMCDNYTALSLVGVLVRLTMIPFEHSSKQQGIVQYNSKIVFDVKKYFVTLLQKYLFDIRYYNLFLFSSYLLRHRFTRYNWESGVLHFCSDIGLLVITMNRAYSISAPTKVYWIKLNQACSISAPTKVY